MNNGTIIFNCVFVVSVNLYHDKVQIDSYSLFLIKHKKWFKRLTQEVAVGVVGTTPVFRSM